MPQPTKAELKCSPIPFSLLQWNGRSIQNEDKLNFLKSMKPDIFAIQEIWKRSTVLKDLGIEMDFKERIEKRGGGTASLHNPRINIQVLKKFAINKDSTAIKIKIQRNYVWLLNIYLHKGSSSQLQKLLGKIRDSIPSNEWKLLCICGDFNVDITRDTFESRLIKSLSKQLGLQINIPKEHTRGHATLDYMITGSALNIVDCQIASSPSDHKALYWQLHLYPIKPPLRSKIPNRLLADNFMEALLLEKKVTDAQSFLRYLSYLRAENKGKLLKEPQPRKDRDNSLLDKLLKSQDVSEVTKLVKDHWASIWSDTENQRYSPSSKSAYQTLRRILKYHFFEKRDGGIITSILEENGTIVDAPDQVENLLLKTMEELQVEDKWGWIEKKKFPKLPRINQEDMEGLISSFSTGKGIAYDGTSDKLFEKVRSEEPQSIEGKTNQNITAQKLRNLWRTDLDKIEGIEESWDARLVPLNKVFPRIPSRRQLRPIMIQSSIVKILESRFSQKLYDYLDKQLDRAQTGFVRGVGIQVNLTRALNRIRLRTNESKNVYGVFIDFTQAYNSVPHKLLFQKLRHKKILDDDEIDFLEQLYARYTIKIGNSRLRYNKGVAQGSIISPALFNIFIEDLSTKLREEARMNIEDLLFYADDLLMLCTSSSQAENCIRIIEEWSEQNGMSLNKDKSGIIVFADRKAKKIPNMSCKLTVKSNNNNTERKWVVHGKSIRGIPYCEQYKYLGTILTPKLSCGAQISYIKKKSAHLFTKLYPYLNNATADARRDMWQTMAAPLFAAAYVLLSYEPSRTNRNNLERLQRGTFKQFLLISKRTNTQLINDMIRKDMVEISEATVATCLEQWEERKLFQKVTRRFPQLTRKNGLRGVPNTWCKLINSQVRPCISCKEKNAVTDRWHLKYHHNVELPHINSIWRKEICPITESKEKFTDLFGRIRMKPLKRQRIFRTLQPIIVKHLENYEKAMTTIMKARA